MFVRVLSIFFFALSLFLSEFSASASVSAPEIKLKTVVIDAGHGGNDPGAISPDRKVKEKDINLDVALKLGNVIKETYPEVNVIYTRKTDVFISLNERTDIANRNHADLFISIHVNSVSGKSSANGYEVFVMGTDKNASNMEVSKRENSVILLEDDYTETYQGFDPNVPESYIFFNLMQNAYFEQSVTMATYLDKYLKNGPITKSRGIKQEPLLVMWRTTMPSVLIEIGFISSASDCKIITSDSGRKEIASNIFKAFQAFKEQYETSSEDSVSTSDVSETSSVSTTTSSPVNEIFYRIQILASKKQVDFSAPDFKGEKEIFEVYKNGYYKYCIGYYSTKQEASEALPAVKRKFPQAFIIAVDNSGNVY